MKVINIKITNLRVIEAAELRFQPKFNLIVGLNGVGKTTALEALRICLSGVVKYSNTLRHSESFSKDDIRVEGGALSVQCKVEIANSQYEYLVHMPREMSVPQEKRAGMPRESVHSTPEQRRFVGEPPPVWAGTTRGRRPFAILFSTTRAVPFYRKGWEGRAEKGIPAAFAGALSPRDLGLSEAAYWMRKQIALSVEKPELRRILNAFERAVRRFLPGFSHLRVEEGRRPRLLIDRHKTPLEVRLLSDGERGTLALVLDLTRRLAEANPEMLDPAGSAEAVVLIDEIELHLHPKWQREIVHNLTAAFPNCQFIATTHSPQVIAAVDPECVILMRGDEVFHADRTLGMDTNWILKHVLEDDARPRDSTSAIADVEASIRRSAFTKARKQMEGYRKQGLDLPEWSVFDARIARLEDLGK